jgi:hypothetical protein
MADPILDQVVLFYLGEVWHQSADVGEVLQTAASVDASDEYSWSREWRKTSERLRALAQQSELAGHSLSASQAYLRAATYLRAVLHRHPDPQDAEVPVLAQQQVENFAAYLRLSGLDASSVQMPYEDTTLPGYFFRSARAKGRAPVLLVHQGRDAWAEDNLHIARAANERGYHALLFDGPGMGKVLRLQKLPFRPDWERVITPVVDYLLERPDVDPERLALLGISMGGFLAPRAAALESRLKLVVANPGVYDWSRIYTGFLDAIDPRLVPLSEADPAAFDQQIAGIMSQNGLLRWGLVDSMWHHGVNTPSALLRDVARYRLAGLTQQIRAKVLVVDAEAEEWGQSRQLFDELTSPKELLVFTQAEAAQFHVQPGALAVATHRLFDWIDREL